MYPEPMVVISLREYDELKEGKRKKFSARDIRNILERKLKLVSPPDSKFPYIGGLDTVVEEIIELINKDI